MRILFVYPNIIESPKDISTGIGMLSAVCKHAGHKTELIDTTFNLSKSDILKKAKNFSPDLIAFTIATNDFEYATEIATLLKKFLNVPIIAGGFHPTIAPEEVISKKCFDAICIGEAEEAFLELIQKTKNQKLPLKIKNFWIKDSDGKIIKNSLRNLNQNLDSLPYPDRTIFDYEKYLKWNHGTATFISTRGCPFQCSYCINPLLAKKYSGKGNYIRFRSIDHLFGEIKEILKNYKGLIKNIEFYDDTFTLDEKRINEFCKRYPSEIGIPFNINARVNSVKPGMFKELKKAGCVRVSIGLEAGDEEIRNNILKRRMSDEEIIQTFLQAKRAGLKVYSFNMVGIPFETTDSIQRTINLNKMCKPDFVGVSIFNAFKGTEIYDLCKKKNLLKDKYSKSYFRESNIHHPNFSEQELRKIRNSFGFNVFISYKPLRAIADLVDRNLSQINSYIRIRSFLIDKLKLLR